MADGAAGGGRGERLRIGVLLNDMVVERWVASILHQVASEPFCDLTLFVVNAGARPRRSLRRRLWNHRHELVFRLYNLVDERMYGSPDDAFSRVDLSGDFGAVPRLAVTPLNLRPFEHRFDAGAIASIRDYRLDVILRFGFNIIRGDILAAARFGVWSFHHGDNTLYRGGPPFFWEMAEGNRLCGTVLQLLTEELDGGKVLYRSWAATDPTSLRRGRNRAYWKSSHFVIRCLRRLHQRGWSFVSSLPDASADTSYDKPIYRTPTNREALGFLLRVGSAGVKRVLARRFYLDQWHVLYRRATRPSVGTFQQPGSNPSPGSGSAFGSCPAPASRPFRAVTPPRDRFYADPFLLSDSANTFLIFEDYRLPTRKGVISYVALEGKDQVGAVLERPYHLSYPFTFSHDGRLYMIPETCQRGTIELYSAERIPDRWRFEHVLIDGIEALDATLFHDGERFWLFACVPEEGAAVNDELCIFHAADLSDTWTPHPLNPVVSDVRRARPAGAVFKLGDDLIRPAQDCARRYGSAIVFHRIDELSPDTYRETVVDRLDGTTIGGMTAAHTYNFKGGFEVIDALRRVPRFLPLRRAS